LIWNDADNDGVQDAGEAGIAGVIVELFAAGADPATATPIATVTTDASGNYFFDNLNPGDYVIHIPAENFVAGAPLANMQSCLPQGGDTANDTDDNGLNAPVAGGISSGVISLQPGTEATAEANGQTGYTGNLPDANVNATVDFSFGPIPTEMVALGNLIWNDTDNDGVQDAGEAGISGVVVELFAAGADPATATPIATVTTGPNGEYFFDNLVPGDYVVHIPAENFIAGAPLADMQSCLPEGGDDATDTDDNGLNAPVAGGISSGVISLQPNVEPTGEGNQGATYTGSLDDNNVNSTVDFSFAPAPKVAVGNVVFLDPNDNGKQDVGEAGVAGVTVQLYAANAIIGSDAPIATVITDANGNYIFDQLTPGDYKIYLPVNNFNAGGALVNMLSSTAEGTDNQTDETGDENGQNALVLGGVVSTIISLQPDMEPATEAGSSFYGGTLDDNNVDLTVDFGFKPELVALGNFVWNDADNDGVQDAGEAGITGVIVELFAAGANPATATPVATATTDANGNYFFDNLAPGDYVVHIPSENFVTGAPLAGMISCLPEGGDTATDTDDNGLNTLVAGGVSSSVISLQPNAEPAGEANGQTGYTGTLDDNNVNATIDFSFGTPPACPTVICLPITVVRN
jgi:SdrD B-like domain